MAKKKRIMANGYVSVYDEEKGESNDIKNYVPEHRKVAEKMLGRKLTDKEIVHHLDEVRSNNSPENLLVLEESQHLKLHAWMNKNFIVPKPNYAIRKLKGCIRCKVCEEPINEGMVYCSVDCNNLDKESKIKPAREVLEKLINQHPMTKIGEMFGVSDNAVRKWCKSYSLSLPDMRGFWRLVETGKLSVVPSK